MAIASTASAPQGATEGSPKANKALGVGLLVLGLSVIALAAVGLAALPTRGAR